MTAIQITPRFLPQIDGLGDYSRLLAAEFNESHGLESSFIIGDPQWNGLAKPADLSFPAVAVRERGASELTRLLADTGTVVLHYVCYGYHERGVPCWLNHALRRWKHGSPGRRLVVVFHELWASGPPWRSEFYLGFVQRRLVTELHRLCDAAVTSTPLMLRMLDAILPGKTTFQPIPSNLPGIPLAQRTLHGGGPIRVIAFGQETSRLHGVRTHGNLLRALHREELLECVRVVGKGAVAGESASEDVRLLRSFLPAEKIHANKDVSAQEGSELMGRSDLFLSYYPSALLCKSGALMAALGCGCVPVLPEAGNAEPFLEGRELLACDGSAGQIARIIDLVRTGGLGGISRNGWTWNDRNATWPIVAAKLAGLLRNPAAAPGFQVPV